MLRLLLINYSKKNELGLYTLTNNITTMNTTYPFLFCCIFAPLFLARNTLIIVLSVLSSSYPTGHYTHNYNTIQTISSPTFGQSNITLNSYPYIAPPLNLAYAIPVGMITFALFFFYCIINHPMFGERIPIANGIYNCTIRIVPFYMLTFGLVFLTNPANYSWSFKVDLVADAKAESIIVEGANVARNKINHSIAEFATDLFEPVLEDTDISYAFAVDGCITPDYVPSVCMIMKENNIKCRVIKVQSDCLASSIKELLKNKPLKNKRIKPLEIHILDWMKLNWEFYQNPNVAYTLFMIVLIHDGFMVVLLYISSLYLEQRIQHLSENRQVAPSVSEV